MNTESPAFTKSPTAPSERIVALDALRGFAILGILIMNIQSFSFPGAAYINPTAYGSLEGLNGWVWKISHIIADMKFMTIFSMLFGAGIVLLTERVEARGQSPRSIHYSRTMWLIVIGLMHGYLLWYGDILVAYGFCALVVYLFRKVRPGRLMVIGLVLFSIPVFLSLFAGFSMQYWPDESIQQIMKSWKPGAEYINKILQAYRGGWLAQMKPRAQMSFFMETFYFAFEVGWRAGGLMLIGMAFYKWGILTGRRSKTFYTWLIVIGLCVGLPLVITGVIKNFAAGWSLEYSMFIGGQFNYMGSIFISCAYIGILMLVSASERFRSLTGRLAAVGRMAFTNYLMQTVICTTIFYGHGLGLFGHVERMWHPLFILGVWAVQLVWSPLWLAHFRFGPAEWLWRSLTYRKAQPMRIRTAIAADSNH